MICDAYNCLFIHIPKTAGQSIEHFFLDLVGLDWQRRSGLLLGYNDNPKLGPESLAHLYPAEYVKCGHISESEFNRLYKFAFVRNPWDRMVSEYRYRYASLYSFSDFVSRFLPIENAYCDRYRHIAPQSNFVLDEQDRMMVDFVGRFESLQQDFAIVCQALAISNDQLPRINTAKEPTGTMAYLHSLWRLIRAEKKIDYRDYYDGPTRTRVYQLYERDIDYFKYQF